MLAATVKSEETKSNEKNDSKGKKDFFPYEKLFFWQQFCYT